MNKIDEIWCEQEETSGKNVVRKRIDTISGLDCYIGLIGATGARMFQMHLDSIPQQPKNFLRTFRGVEVQMIPVTQSEFEYTIILLESSLNDIFAMFIEDIIEKLQPVFDTQEALTLINQRINYWKKLFSRSTGAFLSIEQQRGLFGELFFLKLILDKSSNHQQAIEAWRGADSENQDFALNRNAVEIKTTKASNPTLHIANELQLDYTAWDLLFLGLISVTESSGNQNSIYATVKEIYELLHQDSELIHKFEVRLDSAGIPKDMIENYDFISYSVTSRRFFQVLEGFPVLLKGNLPSKSIYNVKYDIDISTCSNFECQEEDVITKLL